MSFLICLLISDEVEDSGIKLCICRQSCVNEIMIVRRLKVGIVCCLLNMSRDINLRLKENGLGEFGR